MLVPDLTAEVTATDNCSSSLTITQVPAAGALISSGEGATTTVTITVDDGNGNTTDCTVTLTGDDDTAPVITACAPDRSISLNASCELLVPDLTGEVTATDNCSSSLTITQVPAAGALISSGEGATTTVTITVDDGNGNTTDCTVTLTGDDDTAPLITACAPGRSISLNASCELLVPDLTGEVTATDNCSSSLTITQVPAAGALIASSEGATTTVTITVDDGNGNTTDCTLTLTGDDDTAPVITACAPDRSISLNASCELLVPDLTAEVTATDNCSSSLTITQVPAAGALIASSEGATTTVTITVDDGNGNTTDCTVTLTGDDDTAPVITACAPDRNISLNPSCELLVPDLTGEVTATDNCSSSLTITQVPAAGALISSGEGATTTVTITVDDGNGNTTDCTVTLTGDDDTAPVITACAPDRSIVLNNNCEVLVPDLTGEVTATDDCSSSLTITQVPVGGSLLPSGQGVTHLIVITVDDGAGNTATCNVTLSGNDTSDPVIIACPPVRSVSLDAACALVVPSLTGELVAEDNCIDLGSLLITQIPAAGTIIPSGDGVTQTVNFTVQDGNGNLTTCSTTLFAVDDSAPEISGCPADADVEADLSENFTVPDYISQLTVSDNCEPSPGVTQSPVAGTVISGIGTVQNVSITANDGRGNVSVCSFDITLVSTETLSITCPGDLSEYVDADCGFILPDYRALAVTVGDTGITQIPAPGLSLSGHGTVQEITLTAFDDEGNSESCSFDVLLLDTIGPTMICRDILLELDENGEASITRLDIDGGSFDNCALASIDASPTDFTCSDIGNNMVILTGRDVGGNEASCIATITVVDATSPVVSCPADTLINLSSGECDLVVNDIAPGGPSDNCAATFLIFRMEGATVATGSGDASGTVFNLGTTRVWYIAGDQSDNLDSCSFLVNLESTMDPPEGATSSRDSVCGGDGTIILSFTGTPGPGAQAVWYDSNAFEDEIGTGNNIEIAAPTENTLYYIRYESVCDTTEAAEVEVALYAALQPEISMGAGVVCVGSSSTYIATGLPGSQFSWIVENGNIVSDLNNSVTVEWMDDPGSGSISVTETSFAGCVSAPTTLAVEITDISFELGPDVGFCSGETIEISAGDEFISYLWQDGSTSSTYTASEEGWVSVEVTSEAGCTANDSLFVAERPLPVVDLGPDTTLCSEEGLTLDAGTGFELYLWSTGQISPQILVFPDGDQEIWVEVRDANDCAGSDTIRIRECELNRNIWVPTGITVNGDGINDVWNLEQLAPFENVVVDIYDQWGTLVWRSEPGYPEPWDGTSMRGGSVPVDSYHFVIHFNDGSDETLVGYVTVIR